jgi:Zn2+/Cd2+-exporting ATPase
LRDILKEKKFKWLLAALALALMLLVLSYMDIELPLWAGLPISLAIMVAAGRKIFLSGLKALSRFKFSNIDLLLTVAAAGALYLRQFEEAVIIVVLFTIGENLEYYGISKSQKALGELLSSHPRTAYVKGAKGAVPVEEIGLGEVILIKPGDIIALDGKITYGKTLVDESTITGEPFPRSKFKGDTVYAGTKNGEGYIEVEVTKLSKDTAMAKIAELTYKAAKKKLSAQRFIERFSRVYTPVIMGAAILIAAVPVLAFQGSFTHWLTQALTLLIISCPCALVIATPVAVFSALGNATSRGVLIKGGKFLEELGKVKVVAFDKTKTLTKGEPEVSDIVTFDSFSKEDVLSCAAGLERFSEHPIAKSLIEKAKSLDLAVHEFTDFKSVTGKGVTGACMVCPDKEHFLGSLRFINEKNVYGEQEKVVEKIEEFERQGKTVVLMTGKRKIKGIIAITDRLRDEAFSMIQRLKGLRLSLFMLTGDTRPSASFVASSLGIGNIEAGLLPHEKVDVIERLKRDDTHVAMIGDGVNDAPALASASVGISMGSVGSDIAIENSDIALMGDNLEMIPYLIGLGRKSLRIIRFNIFSAILIKAAVLVLAVMGQGNLLLAVFADVGVTVFVIINALRLFAFREKAG